MVLHFRNWVEEFGGIPKLAKELGITEHGVRIWTRGDGSPRAEPLLRILVLSKGKLSYQQIIKETTRNKNKDK